MILKPPEKNINNSQWIVSVSLSLKRPYCAHKLYVFFCLNAATVARTTDTADDDDARMLLAGSWFFLLKKYQVRHLYSFLFLIFLHLLLREKNDDKILNI